MDEDSYSGLSSSSSHLLGSVPAVVDEQNKVNNYVAPEVIPQTFPSNNGSDGGRGYESFGGPSDGGGQPSQPSTTTWQGVFSISSYTQYFNVDTDVVINRLISSLDPVSGDFFSKIDANPDLYGLIWVSTTLVFMIAAFGNVATYLIERVSDSSTSWSFDVSYVNLAVGIVYGYAIVVPLAFFFLIRYLGSNANLVRYWCMWGYSLFIFVLSSILLIIPVEVLRWLIILVASGASACFVTFNLRSYADGNDITAVLAAAAVLQFVLGLFIKIEFFP
ncbi:hypothetical protein V2J09_023358 [Rumex salicifolius]